MKRICLCSLLQSKQPQLDVQAIENKRSPPWLTFHEPNEVLGLIASCQPYHHQAAKSHLINRLRESAD